MATRRASAHLGNDAAQSLRNRDVASCTISSACAVVSLATMLVAPVRAQDVPLTHTTEITVGGLHACARLEDRSVVCWGANDVGQLGDGTTIDRSVPVPVIGLRDVALVRAGGSQTCAALRDGTVRCWGWDGIGETTRTRTAPSVVSGLAGVTDLAVGRAHACALAGGSVRCWGRGEYGQLGDGTTNDRAAPTTVSGLVRAASLTTRGDHTCARLDDGSVRCWGSNFRNQIGLGRGDRLVPEVQPTYVFVEVRRSAPWRVVQIAAGSEHTCALTTDGAVWCWGGDFNGQCASEESVVISSFTWRVAGLRDVVELSAGGDHSCARTRAGEVWCWGYALAGALDDLGRGRRGEVSQTRATRVPGISGAAQIASGGTSACARIGDGTVRCWGSNRSGELGVGDVAPVTSVMPRLRGVTTIAAGGQTTGIHCGVRRDGTVACWGTALDGGLGVESARSARLTPETVPRLREVVEVAPGADHVCARMRNGSVRCWGSARSGQLGDGTTRSRASHAAVLGLAGVAQIASGSHHSCARIDGRVRCWGSGASGELGDGSLENHTRPTEVRELGGPVIHIAANAGRSCAVRADGRVLCWGRAARESAADATPVLVEGIADAVTVSVNLEHACVIGRDERVRCWGSNQQGMLGDGTTDDRRTPVTVVGVEHAVEVGVGAQFACARQEDGRILCWGSNAAKSLGTDVRGDFRPHAVPVQVAVPRAEDLAVGPDHACALVASEVRCWGVYFSGQQRQSARAVLAP